MMATSQRAEEPGSSEERSRKKMGELSAADVLSLGIRAVGQDAV